MKKKYIYSIIVSSALVVGITTGVLAKRVFGSETVDYANADMNTLKADCDSLYKKMSPYSAADIVGKFDHADVINYAYEQYRRCENNFSFQTGAAHTIVEQDVRSFQIKNGDKYFEESVSKSSAVSIANRMYQDGKDGNISLFKADGGSVTIQSDGLTSAKYNNEPQVLTGEEYSSLFGKTIDEVGIYLIVKETIIESNVSTTEDGYVFDFELDPDYATYFYKLQMKNVSNLDKLPVFSSVHLKFTLTKDLHLKHLTIDENYVATMVVDAKTHANIETCFYPNEFIQIPSIDEMLTYKEI